MDFPPNEMMIQKQLPASKPLNPLLGTDTARTTDKKRKTRTVQGGEIAESRNANRTKGTFSISDTTTYKNLVIDRPPWTTEVLTMRE